MERPEPLPRLTSDQLLQLLTAVEREKQDPDTTWPDCFICHSVVLGWTATLGTGSEDERVVTVQPCGHQFTYSMRVAEMLAARAEAAAATEATQPATEDRELDKTKVYLVPVPHLGLQDEPELVHLALYSWVERIDAWATEPGICGRSTAQGPLPEGTAVTCPGCLQRQPVYEQLVDSANRADELQTEARQQQALAGNTVENGAWFKVWLESGKWRWTTSKMTTEQREYAADRVAAYSKYLAAVDGDLEREEPSDLRWWRDDR